MSLAARCPACGTVFRVVQDQLRVSDGWVRCGRCAEVFNAVENLVDLDAEGAEPWVTGAPAPTDHAGDDIPRRGSQEAAGRPASAMSLRAVARTTEPEPVLPSPDTAVGPVAAAVQTDADRGAVPATPAFVLRAERAARWRRPAVRAALTGIAVLATICLTAQAAFAERNAVAARWPAVRPLLAQACALAGCSIEPPRQIDELAVDSSGLSRIEGTSMYRLAVVLKSRAGFPVALPALELTVTDSQGGVIARRVVRLAEMGVTAPAMPAAGEIVSQATLRTSERAISGYTIEIFYP